MKVFQNSVLLLRSKKNKRPAEIAEMRRIYFFLCFCASVANPIHEVN
jgi:hypothetical protein